MELVNVEKISKVFVYREPIHMSRSFKGLSRLIKENLKKNPASGDLFLFMNENCDYLKILLYSKGGHLIIAKKLTEKQFNFDFKRIKGEMPQETLSKLVNDIALPEARKLRVVDTKKYIEHRV